MTVPFKRLPPWRPPFGDGISWIRSVIRNRFSVHGVVLAFPALLQLTVWPLKGGGVFCHWLLSQFAGAYDIGTVAPQKRMMEKTLKVKECYALPIIWSHSLYLDINWSIGHQSPAPVSLRRYCHPYVPPTVTKADNKGSHVNFCSRIEFQKLEVEENAGRHVGLCSTTLKGTEHCWAILCFLTLPAEMKTLSISGNLGAKGKISSDTEQNSMCPLVSWKDETQFCFKLWILSHYLPPWLGHPQSWYLALTGSSHWDSWIPYGAQNIPAAEQKPKWWRRPRRSSREGRSPCSPLPCVKGSEQWASDLLCGPSLSLEAGTWGCVQRLI